VDFPIPLGPLKRIAWFLYAKKAQCNMHHALFLLYIQLSENVYQQIEVEIALNRPRTKNIMPARVGNRLQLVRSNQIKLITAYIDYRMDRLSLNDYVNTSLNVFKNLARYMPEEPLYRMGILHMNIMEGETARVEQEFVRIEADVDNSVMDNRERSYYTYLKAMVEKTRDSIEKARNLIRRNFRIEKEKIFYFWLLLFIDDTYTQDLGALYREIQNLYEQGYNSPIMYLELCEVLNNNPLLFKRISNLEITTIRWGLRHRYISDEVVEEFVKMAGTVKNFDTQIFSIMEAIYEKKGNVDVLKR